MFTKFKDFLNSCLGENTHVGHTIQWFHQPTLEYQLFFPRYLEIVLVLITKENVTAVLK